MATRELKKLKNLSQEELLAGIKDLQSQLFEIQMKKTTSQLEDTASSWKIRKNIARMKTLHTQIQKKAQAPGTPGTLEDTKVAR